ncbi:GNAT family N-acetyltransferase [Geomonas propionica]|uniref:GNAT family N-acetyltransferase n=1 Tax=Geomonas propionica TaxID=2798582 RepID=A0ABS0YTW1_9BACT|nr:GNAT family N-acetyltransferase [Geomonas propionica]MBJ6801406.1 GNAT family N-acetyltransferase [Geomonas propionica]
MSKPSITVIDSPPELLSLAPSWSELLSASVSDSVFLTWEWISSWVESCLGANRRLFVLAFQDKGHLVGCAPFYIETGHGMLPLRTVRFLGGPEGGSDYLDVVCRKGCEREIADRLYDFLMGEGRQAWDLLHLQDIPAESVFLLRFLNRLDEEGKHAELGCKAFCPVTSLKGLRDGWPAAASDGCRKKFVRELAVLEREGGVEHTVQMVGPSCSELESFFSFYERVSGRSGERLRPILQGFRNRRAGNPLRVDTLAVDGREIAALLHFDYKNELFLYLVAVDKGFNPRISAGHLLLGKCILSALEQGYGSYDFLKGDEAYKFHWAAGGRRTLQLRLWRKSPAGVAAAMWGMARQAGKLLLR